MALWHATGYVVHVNYGPGYSVCTHQPKAMWVWNAVHCEPVVAYSSRAVQTICGRPLYMTAERLLRSAFHLRTRHAHPPLRKQQARRSPENSLFFCRCVVSVWNITDSDAHCLPVYTSSVFWLLSVHLFSDAE